MVSFTWSPFNVPELCAGLLTLTGQGASGQPPCSWAPHLLPGGILGISVLLWLQKTQILSCLSLNCPSLKNQ